MDKAHAGSGAPQKKSWLCGLLDQAGACSTQAANLSAQLRIILESLEESPMLAEDKEGEVQATGLNKLDQSLSEISVTHRDIEEMLGRLQDLVKLPHLET